jgi:hypothetical protein
MRLELRGPLRARRSVRVQAEIDEDIATGVARDTRDVPHARPDEAVRGLRRIAARMVAEPREADRYTTPDRLAGRECGAWTQEQHGVRLPRRRPLAELTAVRRQARATVCGLDDEERQVARSDFPAGHHTGGPEWPPDPHTFRAPRRSRGARPLPVRRCTADTP